MRSSAPIACAIWLALGVRLSTPVQAEQIEEKYPGGQLKARYMVKGDKKHGKYEEFYENGRPKIRANYLNDKLSGPYQSFDESGVLRVVSAYRAGALHGKYLEKTAKGQPELVGEYVNGLRHGKFVRYSNGKQERTFVYRDNDVVQIDGVVTHPHTKSEIAAALKRIYSTRFIPPTHRKPNAPIKSTPMVDYTSRIGKFPTDEQMAAIQRLNAYRFLCGVPADVYLDAEYTYFCQKAAALCEKLGRIEHRPENPGLPEDEYKEGFRGTRNSNLHFHSFAGASMVSSVDAYMDDSDERNIARVGHRRWCLNIAMQATGFAAKNGYQAMWSMDHGRKEIPKWQAIPYPARGYMPSEYFGPRHAWSLSINVSHYEIGGDCKARIMPIDKNYKKKEPLELDFEEYHGVKERGTGPALIFRPKKIDVSPGNSYAVEITGLKGADGRPTKIEYFVEFVDIKTPLEGKPKLKIIDAS